MSRKSSTKKDGKNFNKTMIDLVWEKATKIRGDDPNKKRKDACGKPIIKSKYGQKVPTGWEIDHKNPVSKGGTDNLRNLQPLQWDNNRSKGDTYPNWKCKTKK